MGMTLENVKLWRKSQRERLIAARSTLAPDSIESFRRSIDAAIERSFPGLAGCRLVCCWPIKNEYDARDLVSTLRERGALTALPVVVAPKQPLAFREWHPGVQLATGPLHIPYPVRSQELTPDAVLLPMNGWDAQGYRLGDGGAFFGPTPPAPAKKPGALGCSYATARLQTIPPQPPDMPTALRVP